jgi:hypothetical protein
MSPPATYQEILKHELAWWASSYHLADQGGGGLDGGSQWYAGGIYPMGLFKKDEQNSDALETYKVTYKGGHPDLPKAKVGEIRMVLTPDEFQLNPTIGSQKFWNQVRIPYDQVLDVEIVERQMSTMESVIGGADSRKLNDPNNIHIRFADGSGNPSMLRFEMLTGVTVQGQAKKCREFSDRLRVLGIRDRFRGDGAPAGAAMPNIPDQIAQLATLRDQGVLSPAEFEAKKAELLRRI